MLDLLKPLLALSIIFVMFGGSLYGMHRLHQTSRRRESDRCLAGPEGDCLRQLKEHHARLSAELKRLGKQEFGIPGTRLTAILVARRSDREEVALTFRIERSGKAVRLITFRAGAHGLVDVDRHEDEVTDTIAARLAAMGASLVADFLAAAGDAVSDLEREVFGAQWRPVPPGDDAIGHASADLRALAGRVEDKALKEAGFEMARLADALGAAVAADPDRLKAAWPFLDYALPKARALLRSYAELAAASGDPESARGLAETRRLLLDFPELFRAHLAEVRRGACAALAGQSEAVRVIAFGLERPAEITAKDAAPP